MSSFDTQMFSTRFSNLSLSELKKKVDMIPWVTGYTEQQIWEIQQAYILKLEQEVEKYENLNRR